VTLLTPAELAAALKASERTVARMVAAGCPSMLVGARRRFDLAAVTAWTAQQAAAACPSAKTPKAAGTPKPASGAADFTDACRRVQLRVMPGASKPS
jgi:excisionase family DNA binding protein